MRKGIIIILLAVIFLSAALPQIANAQILHPVHWSYAAKKIGKNEAVIFIKATIDDGWHIYSVNQKDGGPVKTSFTFLPSKSYRLLGDVDEPVPVTKYEKTFSMDVHYFEKSVIFKQKVQLTSSDAVVSGTIAFMTCNEQKCLPPDEINFHVLVK
jgi:Disulphide bond corrector protein DsbC